MTREVMDAIPTGRNIQAVGILIPGTTLQAGGGSVISRDVGGSGNMQQSPLTYRGSTNSVTAVDGLRMNDLEVSGQYADLFNDGSFQEVSYTTGADSAEMGQGGLRINMIPKEGGNTFRGSIVGNWTPEAWVWDNCQAPGQSQPCEKSELKGRGIADVAKVLKVYDFNPSAGGPIMRDRLWWQGTYRHQGVDKTVVDSYFDKDPDPYKYEADLDRQAIDDGWASNATIRLTGQITQRNKISWYFDKSNRERDHWSASATTTPEGSARQTLPLEFTETLKFQSTLTNRLLLELGWGQYHQDYTELYQPEVCEPSNEVDPSDPRSCQRSTIYRINDQLTGKNYRAFSRETFHWATLTDFSAKLSYVTGSHNFSGGWNGSRGPRRYVENHTGDLTMRFGLTSINADANGFGPNRVTLALPVDQLDGITMDNGFWANDKWTIKRATITMGLRYDWFIGYVGESSITPNRWLPAHTFSGSEWVRTVPNWKDLSPRVGIAYDLFGTGKTALKASWSRYVDAQATGFAQARNPVNLLSNSVNLGWNDYNRDFTIFNPDGSVQDINFNPNALPDANTPGGVQNELDPLAANSTFGTLITSTTRVDENLEAGFDRRGYTWELDLGVQHEVLPGVSAGLTYFRRLLGGNGLLTDNLNVGPTAYYGPFCVTGPTDPRLPEGGGQEFCGIYQPIPNGPVYTATTDNYSTFRKTYLDQVGYDKYTNYRHGFDISIRARFKNGAIVQGGASIDRSVSDTCYNELLSNPTSTVSPFSGKKSCEAGEVAPFRADIKLLGSYNLPWDFRFSATYQHTPGPRQEATWTFRQAVANANGWTITTTPGSSATSVANASMSIDLMQGWYQYDKSLNQLDLRTSRRFSIGRYRMDVQADLYNIFNSAWVFSESGTYGTSTTVTNFVPNPNNGWLKPSNILNSRAFKMGAQIDF
jgi:hypothetical protein